MRRPETAPRTAVPLKPVATETLISGKGKDKRGGGQQPFRHRSEGGLADRGPLRKLPHLSLSQYDLLETDVSFQPWGSENSVPIPEPGSRAQSSGQGQLQDTVAQDSLSSSCPQCHTFVAMPAEGPVDTCCCMDPPLNPEMGYSDSEVAITLVDTSQPGEPLSLHEPIRIVVTMSSTQNSMTDRDSSLLLKVVGTEVAGGQPDPEPMSPGVASPPAEQIRIPMITLELSEDGGQGGTCPQGSGSEKSPEGPQAEASSDQCPGSGSENCRPSPGRPRETASPPTPAVTSESEGAQEGQTSLDPSSCKASHEKRHARVLSVDSGTDVLLSKSSTDVINEREKTMPTSKSDLEAKEGQIPNESNFLEFVSLLESISTSKMAAPAQSNGSARHHGDRGLLPDHCSQQKKEEMLESEKPRGPGSDPGKPDLQSQGQASPRAAAPRPATPTALLQGSRQRQIIYRVTSQQESSVLQVVSGPETSVQEEMSADAVHVFIDEHEVASVIEPSWPLSSKSCKASTLLRKRQEVRISSSSTTTSESQEPSSGDAAVSALQQQLVLMVARRTQSETPRHVSQDLEGSSCSSAQGKFNREQFYKFIIFPGKWVKVWYDRLTLLALLDRPSTSYPVLQTQRRHLSSSSQRRCTLAITRRDASRCRGELELSVGQQYAVVSSHLAPFL
ncbi:Pecanex-like protein 2 [Tupaia chinensis]|uniref:Pecanex-like protein n=1 Tax=Tupaia chinensis TaxID=246437 RepID=L9L075_TUPCH|nr:Pecanex-like protein 2 [Tupaia chinensis]